MAKTNEGPEKSTETGPSTEARASAEGKKPARAKRGSKKVAEAAEHTSKATAAGMTVRPFPIAEYRAEQAKRREEREEGKDPAMRAPNAPKGFFGILADQAMCSNRDCKAPVLARGKMAWSFTGGRQSGRVLCTVCAPLIHESVKLRWASKKKKLERQYGEKQVRHLTVGGVDNRDRRRRSAGRMG